METVTVIFRRRYMITGVLLWGAGALSTFLFLRGMIPEWNILVLLLAAVGIQIALTTLESLAWKGSGREKRIGQVAFGIDTLINASVVLPYIQRIDATPVWYVADTYSPAPLGDADGLFGLILALGIGAVIAIAPEALLGERTQGGNR